MVGPSSQQTAVVPWTKIHPICREQIIRIVPRQVYTNRQQPELFLFAKTCPNDAVVRQPVNDSRLYLQLLAAKLVYGQESEPLVSARVVKDSSPPLPKRSSAARQHRV